MDRTHKHGMAGSKHHDEHIGGSGTTHLNHAMDHLRATKRSHMTGGQEPVRNLSVNNKELDKTVGD